MGILCSTPMFSCVILPNSLHFIDMPFRLGCTVGVDANSSPEFKFCDYSLDTLHTFSFFFPLPILLSTGGVIRSDLFQFSSWKCSRSH